MFGRFGDEPTSDNGRAFRELTLVSDVEIDAVLSFALYLGRADSIVERIASHQ